METDELPDLKQRYGIKVYIINSQITPVNNQEEDSIFIHQKYAYAVVQGHQKDSKNKNLRQSNRKKRRTKKAVDL